MSNMYLLQYDPCFKYLDEWRQLAFILHCKDNTLTRELFIIFKEEMYKGLEHAILMRDIQEHVELEKKLKLVRKFNLRFTEEDAEQGSQCFLDALKEIEEEFKRESYYNPELPRWKNIIKDIFYRDKKSNL